MNRGNKKKVLTKRLYGPVPNYPKAALMLRLPKSSRVTESESRIQTRTRQMARTTRSQQKHSDDTSTNLTTSHSSPSKPKSPTKKRKRTSLAPPEDQPASKLPRNDDAADRDVVDDQTQLDSVDQAQVDFKGVGDLPLDSQLAQQILDILELSVLLFSLYS